MTKAINILNAAELTLSLLKDLQDGGAENREYDILRKAMGRWLQRRNPNIIKNSIATAANHIDLAIHCGGDFDTVATVSGLISDFGHYCDAKGIDFVDRVRIGLRDWLAEEEVPGDPEQIDIVRNIDIGIGPPGSGCPAGSAFAQPETRR